MEPVLAYLEFIHSMFKAKMIIALLSSLVFMSAVAAQRSVEIADGVNMPVVSLGTCCGSNPEV